MTLPMACISHGTGGLLRLGRVPIPGALTNLAIVAASFYIPVYLYLAMRRFEYDRRLSFCCYDPASTENSLRDFFGNFLVGRCKQAAA